jgi:hypothetical protein
MVCNGVLRPGAKQPDQSGGGSRDFAGLESQPIGRQAL